MKILPIKKLTVNNYEEKYASWLGFSIKRKDNLLVLSMNENEIGEFDAIELFALYAVFIVYKGFDVFVVNQSAIMSRQHSFVEPHIFESCNNLYACVRRIKENSISQYFNVIEITQMQYLYNGFCEWPNWLNLAWVEYPLFIIEKESGIYSIFGSDNLRLEPLFSCVDKFQRLSDGVFLIKLFPSGEYKKIVMNAGVISFEESTTSEKYALLSSVNNTRELNYFQRNFIDCLSKLLEVSDKQRVVKALKDIAYDKVYDLKGLSLKFDRYVVSIEEGISLKSLVDKDFLEKIKLHLTTKEEINDYEICCSFYSRTITTSYDLFMELCKDSRLGNAVKKAAETIVKQRREVIKFTDDQLTTLFEILINDLTHSFTKSDESSEVSDLYNKEHLELYKEQFKGLKRSLNLGVPSPLKPILLLAIISLCKKGILKSDVIELSKELTFEFNRIWDLKVNKTLPFKCNIAMPFGHMKTEPFWHVSYKDIQDPDNIFLKYSVKSLREKVTARIDENLYILLKNSYCRKELSDILLSML